MVESGKDIKRKYDREAISAGLFNNSNEKNNKNDNSEARQTLSNAESGALRTPDNTGDSLLAINNKEKNTDNPSHYINNVSGKKNNKKGKSKFSLKRKSATITIIMAIVGCGVGFFGSQSLLPFSVTEQLRTKFDSISVSNEFRTNKILRKMLNNDEIINPIAQKTFGGKTFSLTKKQQKKLKAQGIETQQIEVDGKKRTVMLFDDGSPTKKIVTADVSTADAIKRAGKINGLDVDVDIDETIDFATKFETSSDFRNGYIKSSRTWRGAVGAWFDSVAVRFLNSNNITRNSFKKFQERVKNEAGGNTKAMADRIIGGDSGKKNLDVQGGRIKSADEGIYKGYIVQFEGDDMSSGQYYYMVQPPLEPNDEGEYITEIDGKKIKFETDNSGDPIPYKYYMSPDEIEMIEPKITGSTDDIDYSLKNAKDLNEAKAIAEDKINKIKKSALGKAEKAANLTCAITSFVGAVELVIAAQEMIQVLQLSSTFFENTDKVKAGEGIDTAINELSNSLTTPVDTKVINLEDGKNADNNIKEETVRSNMSAMQSSGMNAIYSGKQINYKDASVQNFSLGARYTDIFAKMSLSVGSFVSCAMAKIAAASISLVTDIAACVASLGIECVVNKVVKDTIGAAATVTAISAATSILLPFFVTTFTRDLASGIAGEDLGNALVSGANIYSGNNHKAGGGSPASKDAYIAFSAKKKQSQDEYARYQRETKNPFDTSSQYTFMGALVKQLITLGTTMSSTNNIISTASNMISNSIVALLPTASAITTEADIIENYDEVCPTLASVGIVGDAFCNPYIITDMSTIDEDPAEIIEYVYDKGGIDENGNIKNDSNLGKYVKYCSNRSSMFGAMDSNIAGDFNVGEVTTGISTMDTAINAVIGVIPIIGDGLDILTNQNQMANQGWISGENCVADNEKWEEMKKYQRYIEDQRLLESMSDDYTSTATLFIDEYYKENPLDNSYEGILARYAGISKDDVIAVLLYASYNDYIANYSPSERYQFIYDEEELYTIDNKENNAVVTALVSKAESEYYDRNKNVAVA